MSRSPSRLEQMASQLRDAINEESILIKRKHEIDEEGVDIANRLIALATTIEQLRHNILQEAQNPQELSP